MLSREFWRSSFADPAKPVDQTGPKYIQALRTQTPTSQPSLSLALSREVLRILGTIQNMLESTLDMLICGKPEKG